MKYIADLHIHSPFSRATSKLSQLPGLAAWAQVKGIQVLGTGDFTHPGWFRQIREELEPAEPGFFRLRKQNVPPVLAGMQPEVGGCRFVLSAEISSIYKRHGRVRKIHNILFAPDFATVERLNARLARIGNIEADGRPILGLDARDLLEIFLELAPAGFLVPAHIWTPWFSLFGSKSGFDTIEECFDDLAEHIFALETGLSSDPDMNRLVSALDRYTLISNSDCHSPGKLGREANLFDCGFDFFAMREALKKPADGGFLGTVEFFPEEGKYHFDGHRKCNVCLDPHKTIRIGKVCPVCQRQLTIGVMHRVLELADREKPVYPAAGPAFYSLIPLPEILGEILGVGPATKGVMSQYARIINIFGSEFNLLLNVPVEEIRERFSPILAEAVRRMRSGQVIRDAGYDGEFGVIKVFSEGDLAALAGQISLFRSSRPQAGHKEPAVGMSALFETGTRGAARPVRLLKNRMNPEQEAVVNSEARWMIVTAGPGTGKTFTLVARLARLLTRDMVDPGRCVVITFTNRAANELAERLKKEIGDRVEKVFIGTFHRFCLDWFRRAQPGLVVIGDEARELLLKKLFPDLPSAAIREIRDRIAEYYQDIVAAAGRNGSGISDSSPGSHEIQAYLDELKRKSAVDIDGVILDFIRLLSAREGLSRAFVCSVDYLFVDEFQDLNISQYELVRILAARSCVFAIGDPDQAIYGFRGSRPTFFFRFIKEADAETLSLVRNYRSAPLILEAAGALIRNNRQDNRQELVPESSLQTKIELYRAVSVQDEAEFVVRRIEELLGGISHFSINTGRGGSQHERGGVSFKDVAVLYRLSMQASALGEALSRRGIPFQVVDVEPFFMKAPLRAVYYWLRAAAHLAGLGGVESAEIVALLRETKGFAAPAIQKIEREALLSYSEFFQVVSGMELPAEVRTKLLELEAGLRLFSEEAAREGLAAAIARAMIRLGIDQAAEGVERFIDLAGVFGADLFAFAGHLQRNARATVYDEKAEAVSLMTMHAAKGLEFSAVFLAGVEEGLLPCELFRNSDIEEERRLLYVAMTRARETLIISSSGTRTVFGKKRQQEISRFVKEIPSHLLAQIESADRLKRKPEMVQMKLF